MTRFHRQKRGVERGGQCFDHAENVEKAKDCCPGLAFARGPLAEGGRGHPQIIGGLAFAQVQPVHGVPDPGGEGVRGGVRAGGAGLSSVCHGVGFSGVRKTRHGAGFGVSRGQGLQVKEFLDKGQENHARQGDEEGGYQSAPLRTFSSAAAREGARRRRIP